MSSTIAIWCATRSALPALMALVGLALACSPTRERLGISTSASRASEIPSARADSSPAAPASTVEPANTRSLRPVTSAPDRAPLDAVETRLEPDGNDEPMSTHVRLPVAGHFEKVGRHWAALNRICDFAVLGDALYMAHATKPLGLGGASVTRYRPQEKPAFSLAFDWNRPGEPERGGGAGQGFLRLRNVDGRLYVPDADPPYLGLGLATGIEGYVFASDAQGKFARARMPRHLPPAAPRAERAGAIVLPGTLHGFDVIRFRGKLYASTSSAIPPNGTATSSPGTLLTPGDEPGAWRVAFTYAGAPGEASVRLGYMTRFRDRLFVAISPLYGLDRHDFLILSPPRERNELTQADAKPVRISGSGSHTLRWYTDRDTLYWISVDSDGAHLRASDDGEHFRELSLPSGAGAPSDVLRAGGRLLILAENGLYTLEGETVTPYVPAPDVKTPFRVDDGYCAAPLVAFGGELYAGEQTRGNLWKLVAN